MSEKTSFQAVLVRLMQALDVGSDTELARALGITPQSVSGARKRGDVHVVDVLSVRAYGAKHVEC